MGPGVERPDRTVPTALDHPVCFSCVLDRYLFEDFNADARIIATDGQGRLNRLKKQRRTGYFPIIIRDAEQPGILIRNRACENRAIESAIVATRNDFRCATSSERAPTWSAGSSPSARGTVMRRPEFAAGGPGAHRSVGRSSRRRKPWSTLDWRQDRPPDGRELAGQQPAGSSGRRAEALQLGYTA